MIKAILVDDERPALRGLEHLLKAYPDILIVGKHTNPLTAMDEIGWLKPQVVFLDINMPQLKGVDAASRILDLSPGTDIVFVTAFDRYAVEAFELHALDYILKPINPERLAKTIKRVMGKKPMLNESVGGKLRVKCLGRLQLSWENHEPIKWRTEKTRELFAFLIHSQGRGISKEEILDTLWPEDDPERAIRQLYNGIYYIRKALEEYRVDRNLICIDSSYNLKLGAVDFDVQRLHELENGNCADSLDTLEEIEAIYTGDYLEGEDYPWAYSQRERLRGIYEHCLVKLSEQYIGKKQFEKAEEKLRKVYAKNPYEERITELMLELYAETGEKSKAVLHFDAYVRLLQEDLGIEPNEKIQRIYQLMK